MPVYLLHGFRWPRQSIRVHIILNNIDDASPEYIILPSTTAALLQNFDKLYPHLTHALPGLRFVEQYDPEDIGHTASSQPCAFVADRVDICELSLDVGEVIGRGVETEKWAALTDLRDLLAPGEKVGWWVVYNGDEERADGMGFENGMEKAQGKVSRYLFLGKGENGNRYGG